MSDRYCNISVIPIVGEITSYDGETSGGPEEKAAPVSTSGDFVAGYIRAAEADPNIVGILARIDSYGGSGSGGEVIASALARSALPSVALIRSAGASAAYMAALGADAIIASRHAAIGSIGITYSYLDETKKNEQEGLTFISLASGPFKDSGSPNKPLTGEERALFERNIAYYHRAFVDMVAEFRHLPREQVEELSDGATLPGELAVETGLVDALGDQETARQWFSQTLGLAPEEVVFCE